MKHVLVQVNSNLGLSTVWFIKQNFTWMGIMASHYTTHREMSQDEICFLSQFVKVVLLILFLTFNEICSWAPYLSASTIHTKYSRNATFLQRWLSSTYICSERSWLGFPNWDFWMIFFFLNICYCSFFVSVTDAGYAFPNNYTRLGRQQRCWPFGATSYKKCNTYESLSENLETHYPQK